MGFSFWEEVASLFELSSAIQSSGVVSPGGEIPWRYFMHQPVLVETLKIWL